MHSQRNIKFNEAECVYCAVRIEFLNVLQIILVSYRANIDAAFSDFS